MDLPNHNSAEKFQAISNPFPGLRPFTTDESGLFFGREGQVEDVLMTLRKNRFVAVIGSSGSGKSSLIYCGIIPGIIQSGKWKMIQIRPGSTPLKNLYEGFQLAGSFVNGGMTEPSLTEPGTLLRSLAENYSKHGMQQLLVIDQFEELFRYRDSDSGKNGNDERERYVDFIVNAASQEDFPLLIIITMRSDFIGECSRFQNFTSLINRSNYLIPRMTRENFKKVIEGPLAVVNVRIEPGLVNKMLDDVGDNPDQLPVLQHALMRTWDYWKGHEDFDRPISIADYEAIGTMKKALSEHANEAYDELSLTEKEACEKMFRALTERGVDNRGVRRPTKISALTSISRFTEEEVIKVVESFRAPGRSFLTPAASVGLNSESVIDLSHEALMRTWDRLSQWVDEESASVQMYRRLAESAALYQVGKAGLWRPPDLQLASEWKRKNNPTLSWAQRYDTAFERTMVFLQTSEEDFKREEENKIRIQKRQLRRTRVFALVLGSAAIVSMVMFLWTRELRLRVEEQFEVAENQRKLAEQKTREAEEQRLAAEKSAFEATQQRARADSSLVIAELRRREAERNAREAANNAAIAQENLAEANRQRAIAIQNQKEAEEQRAQAVKAQEEAFQRRMLSVGKSMAVKSQQVANDPDLKALLAYQAFDFNRSYGGEDHDVDIYSGLYLSLKSLLGNNYNVYAAHRNSVRSVIFIPGSSGFISAGSDGSVFEWNLGQYDKPVKTITSGKGVIEKISLVNGGKNLLTAEAGTGLSLYDCGKENGMGINLGSDENNIKCIASNTEGRFAFTSGVKPIIETWDLELKSGFKLTDTPAPVNGLALASDGYLLAAGLRNGDVMIWRVKGELTGNSIFTDPDNPVHSITFSPDGRKLACGTQNGQILIFRADNFELVAMLTGHVARVSQLEFSPDGRSLASASFDGKTLFWNMDDFTSPPIIMDDNSGFVFTVAISPDGKYLVSGSADENRLISRPTSASLLADKLCSLVSRNLTQEEWNTYVGEDIEYRKTCTDINELKIGTR